MPFDPYIKNGLLKKQSPNFKQITIQMNRAKKDLETAKLVIEKDPEWGATIAYHAMLRMGRAFLFSHGYLPADGAQHKTVVELCGKLLDARYKDAIEKFEQMRRKRNIFFYEADPFGTKTDAEGGIKTASALVGVIEEVIRKENPQKIFEF